MSTDLTRLATGCAVVTGAGSGLGSALAGELARAGLDLVLVGRDEAALNRRAAVLTADTGVAAIVCRCDLALPHERAALPGRIRSCAPGPVSVLVHCAAASGDDREAVFGVNVEAAALLAYAAMEDMARLGAGQIVLPTSNQALRPAASPYAASKAALERLAACLIAERPTSAIDVLAVVPGLVDSPLLRRALAERPRWLPWLLPRPQSPERVAHRIAAEGFGRSGLLVLGCAHRLTRMVLAPRSGQRLLSGTPGPSRKADHA